MFKLYKSVTIILIFIQLALTKSYQNEGPLVPYVRSTSDLNKTTPVKIPDRGTMNLCSTEVIGFETNNHVFLSRLCRPHSETFNDLIPQGLNRSIIKREASCPLSKEKLANVKTQMNEAISEASTQSNTCDLSETDSSNCIKWLKLLQCAVDFLKAGVKQATSTKAPVYQIDKWDVVYKRIIYSYEQEGVVSRESFSNELKKQFDILGGDLQAAERVINDLKRESKNNKMKMCIENISNGSIENAINYFHQIKKNSVLIDITRTAYVDYGQLQNLKNIIDFGSALSTCSQNVIVFVTLYDLIKENNQLNSPHVMIFQKAVKRCMKDTSIETSLKANTQKIIDSLTKSIRHSNYNEFIQFLKINGNGQDIADYYPEIIQNVYAHNLKNAKTILKFIREIPYLEDECICLRALFENMKNNKNVNSNEILMVAFRLKKIMTMDKYSSVKENLKNVAESLKNSFYPSVRNLIWDGANCSIKSKDVNEYLFSPNYSYTEDSEKRKVFTWIKRGTLVESYWNFSPILNGEHFTIKNNVYNEYLYAAENSYDYDKDRRSVYTWIPGTPTGDQGEWILTPLNDGNDFVMKNKHYDEYLYAANEAFALDRERRRVFSWKGADYDKISSDMIWQIYCKSS